MKLMKGFKSIIFGVGALIIGLGVYAANYSEAAGYLSDDPKACVNCHVMTPQFASWRHSSHARVANCNDCHVPQDNIIKKYAFKAKDGLYHSYVFTSKTEPQVIRTKEASKEVIQQNCIRCHQTLLVEPKLNTLVANHDVHRTDRACWECHRHVPHGRVSSLSSVGVFQEKNFEDAGDVVPDWIKNESAE